MLRGVLGSVRLQILMLILLVGIPIAGILTYSGIERWNDEETNAKVEAQRLAEAYSHRVSTSVISTAEFIQPLANLLATVGDLSALPPESCAAFFGPFTSGSNLDLMAVMLPDGTLFCGQEAMPEGVSLAGRDYAEAVLTAEGAVVGTLDENPVSGSQVLPVLYPIRTPGGDVSGAMVAMLSIEAFMPVDLVESLPDGAFATLTDRDGYVLSRYPVPTTSLIGQSIATSENLIRARTDERGAFTSVSTEGVPSIVGFAPASGLGEGAVVFVGINRDEALGNVVTALWRNSIGLLLFSGMALGIALVGTQRFVVGPIRRMQRTAERMADGDLDVRVGPHYATGELGDLGRSFDSMAASIAARTAEIHELNATLEQRVERRTAELEAANQELEAFSYSVSHDLRSPLRAIDGFAELVTLELGDDMSEAARRYMERVRGGTQRMGLLIDDLLQFSRVGRQEMGRRPFTMDALVQESIEDLQLQNAPSTQWDIAPLGDAIADRAMVRRVLDNLIGNAVKFSRTQDRPKIEIGRHELSDGEVAYFVRDNGVGFDMAYAEKLFGMFQRLHLPEEFEGTGVGLAIVHRIITKHGGRVWAEAAVGQGATFFFTLGDTEAAHDD